MASLYEVSRLENDQVLGIRNWREDVLKRFWNERTRIDDLVEMSWRVFNAEDYELRKQAANHATARYFVLSLQEAGKLDDVYLAYQSQRIEDMKYKPEIEAVKLLKNTMGASASDIDDRFDRWFNNLGLKTTSISTKDLQALLNKLGFDAGPVDGLMGPKTRSALKAFQTEYGLRRTGRADSETMEVLQSLK
jgi:hypothetical protein